MIAPLRKPRHSSSAPAWHEHFLPMLPAIRKQAHAAFRSLDPEARHEAVQEVVANCLVAYVRLRELGKSDLAYPTPLAKYAIRQVRSGRRVGGKLNVRDITSLHCQSVKGIRLERLDRYDQGEEAWLEVLVEDGHATPADVAASRIDFGNWLNELTARLRRMAKVLATGESTTHAARRFSVSPGRISQIRQELKQSWESFQRVRPTTEDVGLAIA
jgi:hypothetical protein